MAETDISIFSSAASTARESVDLPAPLGDESTSIRPRLGNGIASTMAFGASLGLGASSHLVGNGGMKRQHWARIAGIIALAAAILLLMGSTPICRCGDMQNGQGVVAKPPTTPHNRH